jgi:hypothetical protein
MRFLWVRKNIFVARQYSPALSAFRQQRQQASTKRRTKMKIKSLASLLVLAGVSIANVPVWAGGTYGSRITTTRVAAYSSDTYQPISFNAGDRAVVAVQGDGDTELQLLVYDQNNHLIDSDTCQHSRCVATWTPSWTGPFYIVVRNMGWVYNQYQMATN